MFSNGDRTGWLRDENVLPTHWNVRAAVVGIVAPARRTTSSSGYGMDIGECSPQPTTTANAGASTSIHDLCTRPSLIHVQQTPVKQICCCRGATMLGQQLGRIARAISTSNTTRVVPRLLVA
eukprot:3826096-Pleurochrysis_carterae.AAC.1